MSQATLPPEYPSDSGPREGDFYPIPGRSTSDEKRRETDTCRSNNALSPPESIVPLGRQSAGVKPVSTSTRSQTPYSKDPTGFPDGETLVQHRKDRPTCHTATNTAQSSTNRLPILTQQSPRFWKSSKD